MDLSEAIRNRELISFVYDGLPRIVQPATYGISTTGKQNLRGCLIGGESNRNTIPCWELFSENKMVNLALYGENFVDFAQPGYTRGDSAFSTIIAEY